MARGPRRRRHVDRLAAIGSALLIGSFTILGTAAPVALAANSADLTPAATATGTWTDADNALSGSDDGLVASTTAEDAQQGYRNFGFALPAGSIVDGITVKVDAASTDASGCRLGVRLSGNGGDDVTSRKIGSLTDASTVLTFGAAGDYWATAWDASRLSNANFRVILETIDPGVVCDNDSTFSVDWLSMTVTYRTIAGGTNNPALSSEVCDTADINFVVDMSGSIGPQGGVPSNLDQLRDGITGFVDAFQAAGGDGRYSGTRFSGGSADELTSGYVSADAFNAAINGLSGPAGLTPTGIGINTAAGNNSNDRLGAPNVMFVVTDGSPNVPNGNGNDLSYPDTWLDGANAAIAAADDARAGSGASKFVVKAVYLSTDGDPGDTSLPFTAVGDAAWAKAVMQNIGGGAFLNADFKDFAGDLISSLHCAPPPPTIEVTKTASPVTMPEPGGNVTFTVEVHNMALDPIKLDSLVDDVYGDLDGKGTCDTGGTIGAGDTYTCHFSGAVSGAPGSSHTDTVTADALNSNGKASDSDDATVRITDVLPEISVDKTASPEWLPAGGGSATFTVVVTNHSVEPVTISSLVDNVYGDLNGQGSCAIGAVLAPDASYTCSFVGAIPDVHGSHVDVVTAKAVDDEQNQAIDDDDALVTVADPTPTPTPTPSGEVEGATGTPHVTPPPTDATPVTTDAGDAGLPALLVGILAIGVASFLAVPRRTPARVRAKPRNRRIR